MITTVHFHDVLNQHIAMKKPLKLPSASWALGSCDRDIISYQETFSREVLPIWYAAMHFGESGMWPISGFVDIR